MSFRTTGRDSWISKFWNLTIFAKICNKDALVALVRRSVDEQCDNRPVSFNKPILEDHEHSPSRISFVFVVIFTAALNQCCSHHSTNRAQLYKFLVACTCSSKNTDRTERIIHSILKKCKNPVWQSLSSWGDCFEFQKESVRRCETVVSHLCVAYLRIMRELWQNLLN